MQPLESIVPASGQQEFDYSGSNLSRQGSLILGGAVFTIAAVVLFIALQTDYARDPSSIHGPLWQFQLILTLFISVGIAFSWLGVFYTRVVRNEKITLTPTEVIWIDYKGQERIRSPYTHIRHSEETILSRPETRPGKSPHMHHRCTLITDEGRIVFSDDIADYNKLKDYFLSIQTDAKDHGIFNYRSIAIFVISALVLPATLFLSLYFVNAYMNGDQMNINGVMQKTPAMAPLFVVCGSAVFWFTLLYAMLVVSFARIVISGGRLSWYGPTRRLKIDVPLSHIKQGSFKKVSYKNGGSYRYSVLTLQGKVKWSDSISRCSDLVRIMQKASDDPPPLAESNVPPSR